MNSELRISGSARQVYAHVRERLRAGELAPGARVTEQQLAEELNLSRTPVREALRLLVADGMLRFRPNFGTFVAAWSESEIREIFDLRVLLESEVASLAAQRASAQQIVELIRIQDEIDEHQVTNCTLGREGLSTLNRAFHEVISAAGGSARLTSSLANAIETPIVLQTFKRYSPMQLQRSFSHHRELIDAISAKDAQWARAVMVCHIRAAEFVMLSALSKEGALPFGDAPRTLPPGDASTR